MKGVRGFLRGLENPNFKHGLSGTRAYLSYMNMLDRCYREENFQYKDYGGRGITVCARWKYSFESFYEDMGERLDGLTLERRDNDGNYEPDNCYWATRKEQANNRHQRAKLTEDQVREIRRIYVKRSREFGAQPLALRYGVDPVNILLIVKRETWKHIK